TTDEFWKHDGLAREEYADPAHPYRKIVPILAQVPLTFWEERFDRTPAQLLDALKDQEKDQMVLLGWCQAARHFSTSNWYMLIWRKHLQIPPAGSSATWQQLLWRALIQEAGQQKSEALVTYSIEQEQEWKDLVELLPTPWSPSFSDFLL